MVISSKLVDINGLEFAVSEDTDTVDVGGFSDSIQAVGAETAKFSGGSTRQANGGLRIGMTQLKINTGAIALRTRSIVGAETTIGNPQNAIGAGFTDFLPSETFEVFLTVDFGIITTADISASWNTGFGSALRLHLETSTDGIIYTEAAQQIANASSSDTITAASVTYRFARLRSSDASGSPSPTIRIDEVFESNLTGTVTVKVRSSTTLDTANGTVIITDQVMNELSQLTFDTDLLLTGNPTGDFVTVEIVSLSGPEIPVTLSDITSIKEV